MAASSGPQVGEVWAGKGARKAPVRIGRRWESDVFCGGGDFVRCHPVRGGKDWVTTVDEFVKRYEKVS